jgi:hypothetical protein
MWLAARDGGFQLRACAESGDVQKIGCILTSTAITPSPSPLPTCSAQSSQRQRQR